MSDPHDTAFTVGDLAKYLKSSGSTLYKLAQERSLPGVKAARHRRFHRDAADAWLQGRRLRRVVN